MINITQKERIFYLDFIRAISIILVIIYHFNGFINERNLLGDNKLPINLGNTIGLGEIGVALFFLISGAALMHRYSGNFSTKNFFFKRFLGIYPLFWITYVLTFLYLFYRNKTINHSSPNWTILFSILGIDVYMGNVLTISNFALIGEWFLGCIILIYLFFPLLRYIMIKKPHTLLILTIVYYVIIIQFYDFKTPIHMNFITRIPEFIFGMYLMTYCQKVKTYHFSIALIISIVILSLPIDMNRMYRVTIIGISFFCVLRYIADLIKNNKLKSFVAFISKYSYAIFLVHHLILMLIIDHFYGKVLTYSEVFCVFLITCTVISVISVYLSKFSNKVVDMFLS
ncbi:acyltransferase [Paenibacillus faecis]|uniref:Acyltransferase n=1 Tax=Paenibacillus faecis TaxID=862114 RepID=A0A5D0CPE9_9BACL|nr:acyltransferase [Paenibacillus faecis]